MSSLAEPPAFDPRSVPRLDRPTGVRLLHADGELRAAVPADERQLAERILVAPVETAERGAWSPDGLLRDARNPVVALLLDGVVTREVVLGNRGTTHLFGPGDVFDPWQSTDAALPSRVRWRVEEEARVAVLDDRFTAAQRRWPQLGVVIARRMSAQLDRLAVQCALTALPRVEERVLALFWHLADRWGRVSPDGVTVRLKLTHDAIGCLVGAQRPTVTLALRELAQREMLTRLDQSRWLLAPGSEESLGPRALAAA